MSDPPIHVVRIGIGAAASELFAKGHYDFRGTQGHVIRIEFTRGLRQRVRALLGINFAKRLEELERDAEIVEIEAGRPF